jgi:predicted RecA/RadA family phage recombinase
MKNFIQPGDTITVAAPYELDAGEGARVGMIFGVAIADAANGAAVELATRGVFEIKKTSAQAWTVGDAIYWNNSTKVATTATTAGNIFIGVALAAALNPSATGIVRLNGAFPAEATS